MAATYTPIQTTTLGSAQASVTFSSFSGYTDLVLVMQTSISSGTQQNKLRFNGDTATNYSATILSGNGTSAISTGQVNNSSMLIGYDDYNTSAFGQMTIVNIQNYANTTTYKTAITRGANANTGVSATAGLWRSTAAITSITLLPSGGANYTAGSTFTLWGILNA